MRKGILLLAVICFLLTGMIGCASLSDKEDSLQTQSLLKFSDLPIPTGFKMLAKNSYSFESSGMRVGLLRYQGKASLDQVVNFYKEQMSMYNWTLLNITQYGDCIMNFEREQESCIISISPKGSTSVISIAMGPKSQVLPKKTKQAVK
ncbi:MAG: hypothetical protein Q7K98_05555 [Candidatus Omnitrophota bacterium]|nr:hypothetical protein [Candidatus Omnitrophota bacterium]